MNKINKKNIFINLAGLIIFMPSAASWSQDICSTEGRAKMINADVHPGKIELICKKNQKQKNIPKSDYENPTDAKLDSENSLGKTVKLVVRFYEIVVDNGAPYLMTAEENQPESVWKVYFNKKFNEEVKQIGRLEKITLVCKIIGMGAVNRCELIAI